MIDLKKLLYSSDDVNRKVIVNSNSSSHNYEIGREYKIRKINKGSSGPFSPSILTTYLLQDSSGWVGNNINSDDFSYLSNRLDKDSIVNDLENLIEFIKESDLDDDIDINNKYYIWRSFKEIKSANTDMDKLKLIERLWKQR